MSDHVGHVPSALFCLVGRLLASQDAANTGTISMLDLDYDDTFAGEFTAILRVAETVASQSVRENDHG